MLVQNIKDYGEELLNNRKLLRVKRQSQNGREYDVVKYTAKAFYDNVWEQYPLLKQARGHVFDAETGDIVVRPFDKIFNLGENGTTVHRDRLVACVKKYNGFMAAVTPTPYGPLFSTTGSIDSPYVELAKKYLTDPWDRYDVYGETWLFEICCPEDPHIVPERGGAHLLAIRDIPTGVVTGIPWNHTGRFGDLLPVMKQDKGEGFMVVDVLSGEYLCKVKTPYYLALKFLARVNDKKASFIWDEPEKAKRRLDEDFAPLVDALVASMTREAYLSMDEQSRLAALRGMLLE